MIGTLNMLGLAKRVGARLGPSSFFFEIAMLPYFNSYLTNHITIINRILLTSTSEVYGDPLVHPQDESYWGNVNPIGIYSPYI